jgi:hypothetical protein
LRTPFITRASAASGGAKCSATGVTIPCKIIKLDKSTPDAGPDDPVSQLQKVRRKEHGPTPAGPASFPSSPAPSSERAVL